MTSMIFGAIYLTHGAYIQHRREKQRLKNYERWEGLRDEYDLQKQTQRSTQSLDLDRTGSNGWTTPQDYDNQDKRDVLTLRDQQEANDARLGWRPHEVWNGPQAPDPRRHSIQLQPTGRGRFSGEFRPQKTGATWDDGLPAPLRVTRSNFEEESDPFPNSARYDSPSRQVSQVSRPSGEYSRASMDYERPRASGEFARSRGSIDYERPRASGELSRTGSVASSYHEADLTHSNSNPRISHVEPIVSHCPGGRMAELLEQDRAPRTSSPLNPNRQIYNAPLPVEQKLPEVSSETVGEWWTRP